MWHLIKTGDKVRVIDNKNINRNFFNLGEVVEFLGFEIGEEQVVCVFTNGKFTQGLLFGQFEIARDAQ